MSQKQKLPDAHEFQVPIRRLARWIAENPDPNPEPPTQIGGLFFHRMRGFSPPRTRAEAADHVLTGLKKIGQDRQKLASVNRRRVEIVTDAKHAARLLRRVKSNMAALVEPIHGAEEKMPQRVPMLSALVAGLRALEAGISAAQTIVDAFAEIGDTFGLDFDLLGTSVDSLDKAALILRDGGFSYREVAALLGTPSQIKEVQRVEAEPKRRRSVGRNAAIRNVEDIWRHRIKRQRERNAKIRFADTASKSRAVTLGTHTLDP